MEANTRQGLSGLRVVSFESRRATEMAEVIRRYGGEPIAAPSMREVPLSENSAALALLSQLEAGAYDALILLTGVGTESLNQILLSQFSQERITSALKKVRLIARGPKPTAALKKLGLEPSLIAPSPNTWRELLAALDSAMDLKAKRLAVQEYGISNPDLLDALKKRGAQVTAIPIYRWALPEDIGPLREAIRRLVAGEADVALFTNGAQVDHLFQVASSDHAKEPLRRALEKVVIASIGPVCTEILEQFDLVPDIEASPPKMGVLIAQAAESARSILKKKQAAKP